MSAKIKAIDIRKEYEELEKDKLLDEVVDLVLENDKLKRKLRKYENPNTPPSKQGFDKPEAQGIPVGRKAGRKSNHNGKTREIEKPTIIIPVTTDRNPLTGNRKIKKTNEYEDIIVVDFEVQKTIKSYRCFYYEDLITGERFMARHPDMPESGIFGKNTQALASILNKEYRVPVEGVASIFTNVFDISMTPPTALNITNRVADKVAPKYEAIGKAIASSEVVYADETGSNQNGISEWLWGFFTTTFAFFVFFHKRGGDIVENVLGKNFKGKLSCDGWQTYKTYSEKYGVLLQRCWAHLIREVKYVCKDVPDLNPAYIWIIEIFERVKKARALKTERLRRKKHAELTIELDNWTSVYFHYHKMRKLVTLVQNGEKFWFTCILHPEVEPTNNRAERGIRKFVVLEKIMGCLRSERGKRTTQILMSLFGTWKLQGLNPYKELRAIL